MEICDRIVSWTFSDASSFITVEHHCFSEELVRGSLGVSLSVKCSNHSLCAVVAQLVEHVLGKDEVTGSIPVNGSISGWIVKRSNTADCKSVGSAFEGSNPSPPTMMGISLKDVSVRSTVTRRHRYFERFAFSCLRGSLVIAHSRKRDARNSLRRLSSAGRATVL